MIEEIKKIALSEIEQIEFRSSNFNAWDKVLSQVDYLPIDYTQEILKYRFKFLQETNKEVIDLSMIIYQRNKPSAVWPVSLTFNKHYEISCFGRELKEPIFIKQLSNSDKKSIIKKCFSFLKNISNFLKIKKIITSSLLKSKSLDFWGENCLSLSSKNNIKYNLFLDLTKNKDEILSFFRPVYRNYFNSWKKKKYETYSPKILKTDDKEIWNKFKTLHKNETGRVTRSNETWDIHYENIQKNKAFLSYISHKNTNELLGGAYFSISKDESYYGVGKYSQKYKKEKIPLGHLIQFSAIEEMISRKIKMYKIGLFHTQIVTNIGLEQGESDKKKLSEKEKSISYFAKGFASDIFPEIVFTNSFE